MHLISIFCISFYFCADVNGSDMVSFSYNLLHLGNVMGDMILSALKLILHPIQLYILGQKVVGLLCL